MRSREQVIWDFVQSWLAKAERDLHAAELLLGAPGGLGDVVGFHSQQAVEKLIKTYLVRHQIEFPKTHDLAVLRKLMSRSSERLAEELAFADWLTPFGVEIRYPGEIPELGRNTAQEALAHARETRRIVLDALHEYLQRGRPESQ